LESHEYYLSKDVKFCEHEFPFVGSQDNTLYTPQINYDFEYTTNDIARENYDSTRDVSMALQGEE